MNTPPESSTHTPRRRLVIAITAVLLVVGLFAFSSYVPPLSGIVRSGGQPAAGAVVVYEYHGSIPVPTPHPSHVGVRRGASLAITDEEGRFHIGGKLLLFCPAMSLHIRCVYAPSVHSAYDVQRRRSDVMVSRLSPLPRHMAAAGAVSHADYEDQDLEFDLAPGEAPLRWIDSLHRLRTAALTGPVHVELGRHDRLEVAKLLLSEYRAFTKRYGAAVAPETNPYSSWSATRRQRSYEPHAQAQIAEMERQLGQ